jgi:hypothetical protein
MYTDQNLMLYVFEALWTPGAHEEFYIHGYNAM